MGTSRRPSSVSLALSVDQGPAHRRFPADTLPLVRLGVREVTPIVHMDADGWRSVRDLGNQRQRPDEANVVLVAGKLDVDGVRDVDAFAQWGNVEGRLRYHLGRGERDSTGKNSLSSNVSPLCSRD